MSSKCRYKLCGWFIASAFSLNTVVGFTCSIGLDLGFNADHHNKEAPEPVVHIHEDGKRHTHYEGKETSHHQEPAENHQQSKEEEDNCCNQHVLKIEQLDKAIPGSFTIIHPVFLNTFFAVFYNTELPGADIVKNIKQFVRCYHPPISDIYIAVQTFRI
jgi:hypothetical protein